MKVLRAIRHLLAPPWLLRRNFPPAVLGAIEAAIGESERWHRGEIRFAVEGGLELSDLWRGVSARERAIEVFSRLRVWDTEENTGVLIYVQWLDRRVEIVVDRGVAARVAPGGWAAVCRGLESAFRSGRPAEGACEAVREVGRLLAEHFPARPDNPDELPDRPVLL